MKRSLIWLIIIVITLLCSCYQDEAFPPIGERAYISIANHSETAIYWQLREPGESETNIFNRLLPSAERIIETKKGNSLVLTYAGLIEDTTEIIGDVLVFKQTTATIHTENITAGDWSNQITFVGDSAEITCIIAQN